MFDRNLGASPQACCGAVNSYKGRISSERVLDTPAGETTEREIGLVLFRPILFLIYQRQERFPCRILFRSPQKLFVSFRAA